ncbi:MAG: MarR family winged helix-turn-helix transcriptional regulator [Sporolactobacillus sp.]
MIDILRSIGLITRITTSDGNQLFKNMGLNNNQFIYVIRVSENPGIIQSELADLIHIDHSTSLRTIQKLERSGFIERRKDAVNKKIRRVYPTAQALSVYPLLHEYESDSASHAVLGLSSVEQKLLNDLLFKVVKNVLNKPATDKLFLKND